jgi:hypothetical protein
VRRLVVTRGGRAVGVVSVRDPLAASVTAVTTETVLVMVERMLIGVPGHWLD